VETRVRRNESIELKLRAPIVNRDNIKIALGVEFFRENYSFERLEELNNPLYNDLEERHLNKAGASIFVVKPFFGRSFLLFRGSLNLNGDYANLRDISSDFARGNVIGLCGIKLSPYSSMAFGLSFGYSFGSKIVLPVFVYNKTFSNRLGVELLLPASARVRYELNEKNWLYSGIKLSGASYGIRLDETADGRVYNLSKTEIRFNLLYEREIYDFLWFGIEGGLRHNFQFELTETGRRNSPVIVENELAPAFYFNASVFIVPPRKFLK
jgi:hypothetical protein